MMQQAFHTTTHILPGHKIEITAPDLQPGETVDVFVLRRSSAEPRRRSVVDILAEAPGQRLFRTAGEVEAYLHDEHATWER